MFGLTLLIRRNSAKLLGMDESLDKERVRGDLS